MNLDPVRGAYFIERGYLNPATNFDGLEKKSRPDQATNTCPTCKGYGRWNSRLNVYPSWMEVKHPHATHTCTECNGSGWKWDLHKHDWKHVALISNCYNQWECSICKKRKNIDSGD